METVALASLPDWLLSHGTTSFTADDAARLSGLPTRRVYPGLKRLADRGLIFSPARGFYVPIDAQFRSWRSVPATQFIDPMMRHLDRRYYVALLSAAELHGAAHQRPQAFQVIVNRALPARRVGRTSLRFFVNSRFDAAATATQPTPTGTLVVATPETTALDLAARPRDSGGLDNIATVIVELADDDLLDPERLGQVAAGYSASAVRRVGWILNHFTTLDVGDLLNLRAVAPTMLDPHGGRHGVIDPVWNLIVNTDVKPDT
ncbi:MAG: type IV toxin-antitoxin system AbiEi family antitoxin domain-containing protein [Acidimicrobiales bacterium]